MQNQCHYLPLSFFFDIIGFMNRRYFVLVSVFCLFAAGCNLPSASDRSRSIPGNMSMTATAIAMDHLVKTVQAGDPFIPEPAATEVPADNTDEWIWLDRPERELQPAGDVSLPQAEAAVPEVFPAADANRVPPELPAIFQTEMLNRLDTPHTYEEDTCTMLKNRWGEGKAAPGTIVMAIMYHSIVRGETVEQDNAITVEQHKHLIKDLHDQGFTAINTEQFIAFMESNEWIPERSVLLIVDDRHSEQNYIDHFKDYYDQWGWPVINAWISADGTLQSLWDENAHAEEIGLVDHQAHGVVHNQPMGNDSTDEYLIGELKGSKDRIEEHFHKTPRAIIWPGGGYGARPIEVAKEYGYKVGFTTHPRGPVMYNWVPLCDVNDSTRPYYYMDGNQDPLFVIPRYWDTDAAQHVDTVRQIGKAARDYLYSVRETEVEYYDIVCKPVMGEL